MICRARSLGAMSMLNGTFGGMSAAVAGDDRITGLIFSP